MGYNQFVIEIRQTDVYAKWYRTLRDENAKARIDIRIRRVSLGNFGDVKSIGEGVRELGSIMALATGSTSCSAATRW